MPRQGLASLPDLDRTQEPGFSCPKVSIHTDAATLTQQVGRVIIKTTGISICALKPEILMRPAGCFRWMVARVPGSLFRADEMGVA